MPFFSIIIPSYNRASFLPRAIESVLAQYFPDWELIIVDDGSTDNTQQIVENYGQDPRVKYIYQTNQERSAARNTGIDNSIGEYICFMDSDEYLDENRLELLNESIRKNGNKGALYYTDIRFEYDNPALNYIRKGIDFDFPIDQDALIQLIIGNPQFCASRAIFERHKFNSKLSVGEDMELLFRIAEEFPLIYLESQATITEIEHDERSVNNRSKSSIKQLKTLKVMFSNGHPANKVRKSLKRWLLSEVYFNASLDFLIEKKITGLNFIIRSLLINPWNEKTKYKINLVLVFLLKRKKRLIKLLEGND